ncbi:hypothetical protein skT53_09550 [Effusibacillus dendaii]|uniref:Major facilitator superfamily (MFS) profile domain-containing protein n=1 Tax=Effusibacillus dendaii TaxID=2743772 RepID=A0A7I8DBS2_9BACL|nr:hypothetical protein skT53_09550 [Effusibacillus dendaii]
MPNSGVGQVVGPIVAGVITAATHSYNLSMLLSGLILLAAVVLLWLAGSKTRERENRIDFEV